MLESLGQHLGVAIESLRLASRDRELAIAEERNLLAQELHDSIAQALAFLNLQTQMLRKALAEPDEAETVRILDEIAGRRAGVLRRRARAARPFPHPASRKATSSTASARCSRASSTRPAMRTEFSRQRRGGAARPRRPDAGDAHPAGGDVERAQARARDARRGRDRARPRLRVHRPRRRPRLRPAAPRRTDADAHVGPADHARAGGAHRRHRPRALAPRPRHGGRAAACRSRARKPRRPPQPPRTDAARGGRCRARGRLRMRRRPMSADSRDAVAPRRDPHRRRRRPHAVPARHHGAAVAGRRASRSSARPPTASTASRPSRQHRPTSCCSTCNMPGISGIDAMHAILKEAPGTHIVMLTVSEDADDLMLALRAGALGYLLKNIESDFLVDAVRRAADGESVMSPEMTGKLLRQVRAGGRPRRRSRRCRRASARSSPSSRGARATRRSPATSTSPRARSRSTSSTSCASSSSRAASRRRSGRSSTGSPRSRSCRRATPLGADCVPELVPLPCRGSEGGGAGGPQREIHGLSQCTAWRGGRRRARAPVPPSIRGVRLAPGGRGLTARGDRHAANRHAWRHSKPVPGAARRAREEPTPISSAPRRSCPRTTAT